MAQRSLRLTGSQPGTGAAQRSTSTPCHSGLPKPAATPARATAQPAPQPAAFKPLSRDQAIPIRDRLLTLNSDGARGALRLLYTAFPDLIVAGDQVRVPAPNVEAAAVAARSAAKNSVREIAGVPAAFPARLPEADAWVRPYAVDGEKVAAPPAPSLTDAIKASRRKK